jgi:FAD/FMN-containing dehydrogenase
MEKKLQMISKERYTWQNATGNVNVTPLRFFYPENKEDIIEIVKDAEQRGLRVRAVGSGHSFSEVTVCKDYLLSMKKMDGVEETKTDNLKLSFQEKCLVDIEAGIILKVLNKKLDKKELALPNMGAVDFQTISGALMTGTHGTGIRQPAFPDLVCSIKMVGTGGQLYQVEPSDGMTDKVKHNTAHGDSIKLIQDDDIFYSAVLSFGGMGIAYEITMEVKKTFWMKERRDIEKWSVLRQKLLSGEFMRAVESTDFMAFRVNPYEIKNDHTCAVVRQCIVKESERPRGLGAKRRNLLSTVLGDIEYLIESTIRQLNRKPERSGKNIERALKATKDPKYFAKSYKVLYQSGLSVIRHGISSEFAFDASAEKIVEVIEAIFKLAKANAENGKLYQASHVPVRFVQPSKAFLSSAYGRKTVYIDVPLLHNTIGDMEILERYQNMMIGLGGIPHWGKVNNQLYQRNDFVKEKFVKHALWTEKRNQMDPKGTFLNDFIIKMGLA